MLWCLKVEDGGGWSGFERVDDGDGALTVETHAGQKNWRPYYRSSSVEPHMQVGQFNTRRDGKRLAVTPASAHAAFGVVDKVVCLAAIFILVSMLFLTGFHP